MIREKTGTASFDVLKSILITLFVEGIKQAFGLS